MQKTKQINNNKKIGTDQNKYDIELFLFLLHMEMLQEPKSAYTM